MRLPYRLSTIQAQDGYCLVNGRPHGLAFKKQYEVTFHFDSIDERKEFIRLVKQEWAIYQTKKARAGDDR